VPLSSDIPGVSRSVEGAGAFDEFFAANYAALTRLVYRVVGDIGWAEELAAEAFWKLHRNPPASEHNLVGWLYRTGLRLALDNLKKRKRRAHYEALAPEPGAMQSPEDAFDQIERQARVRRVLAALKPEYAALLVLRSEGSSLNEMASILALNPGSVGTRLARADRAFRKEYVSRYGER
jgi:RNA polymerase sigma-70 factor (ECF subfamily)